MTFPDRRVPPDGEQTAKVPAARSAISLCLADVLSTLVATSKIGDVTVRSPKRQRDKGEMTFPGRREPPDCEEAAKVPAARSAISL